MGRRQPGKVPEAWGLGRHDRDAVHATDGRFPDLKHATAETRFIGIGKANNGRHVFVAFTLREGDDGVLIRPISARDMHKKEIEHYEKEAAKTRK